MQVAWEFRGLAQALQEIPTFRAKKLFAHNIVC